MEQGLLLNFGRAIRFLNYLKIFILDIIELKKNLFLHCSQGLNLEIECMFVGRVTVILVIIFLSVFFKTSWIMKKHLKYFLKLSFSLKSSLKFNSFDAELFSL